ncbi:hypothetical protein [Saccharothrix sp. Mg75]|uniref:hypothetical protein n=1 Tax=Saccharothrix sp. Mg75 TaxID=3445357 RepID=UPI003EED3830
MLVQALVAAVIAAATPVPPGVVTGIDVATRQAGIDFARVRADGHGFVVVKTGGSQLSGGPCTGSRYREQVAAFFTRVHERVGDHVPWLYPGAADLRSGTWPRTIAFGAKLWVASWGANDGGYPGEPDLGGAYPAWSAHQYTSVGAVGGVRVDLSVARPAAFDVVTPGEPPDDPPGLPKTSTEQDGVPGAVFRQRVRNRLAREAGYAGPIDGVRGPNSWRAVARFLNQDRYDQGCADRATTGAMT